MKETGGARRPRLRARDNKKEKSRQGWGGGKQGKEKGLSETECSSKRPRGGGRGVMPKKHNEPAKWKRRGGKTQTGKKHGQEKFATERSNMKKKKKEKKKSCIAAWGGTKTTSKRAREETKRTVRKKQRTRVEQCNTRGGWGGERCRHRNEVRTKRDLRGENKDENKGQGTNKKKLNQFYKRKGKEGGLSGPTRRAPAHNR